MKLFRVGIIGIGNIAYAHIEALKKLSNVEVVSITSRHDIENKSQKLGIKNYYTDYKQMLDKEVLDSVHICTSNDVHYEIASYAIKKGVHVILEKPMTMNVEEATKLELLARSSNVIARVHFHNRFYAINQYVKNHIEQLGDIVSIHGEYTQGWAASPDVYNWRSNQKYSGLTRVVADIGTHYFDLIEFMTGHKIVEVSARFKQVYDIRSNHKIDTEDIGVILYQTNLGAIGSVLVSQSVIGNDNVLDCTISGKDATFKLRSSATEALYADLNHEFKVIKQETMNTLNDHIKYRATTFTQAFTEAFRQFYYNIKNKDFKSSYANFTDGLHSMKLIEAIYRSHHEQKWIQVKQED